MSKYPHPTTEYAGSNPALNALIKFPCLVYDTTRDDHDGGAWCLGPGAGYTTERDQAYLWKVGEWLDWCQTSRGYHLLQILEMEWESKKPEEFDLKYLLGKRLVDGLAAYPQNQVFRTMALARLKKPIPDEAKTYEEIEKWAKENVDPKAVARFKPGEIAFLIEGSVSDTASGLCRFEVPRYASKEYSFHATKIIELAQNCNTWEELVEQVRDLGHVLIDHDRPHFAEIASDDDDISFDRFDVRETNNYNTHMNFHTVAAELERWMAVNAPELQKQLVDAQVEEHRQEDLVDAQVEEHRPDLEEPEPDEEGQT